MNATTPEETPAAAEAVSGASKFVLVSFLFFFLLIGTISLSELIGVMFR